eukprot:scpid45084/ scgid33145/ 
MLVGTVLEDSMFSCSLRNCRGTLSLLFVGRMEEGELFSFRVVRGPRPLASLLKWTIVDVNESMTVCDVFRQLGKKIADSDAVTDEDLVCQVSASSSGKDAIEVSASQRVARLSRFGFFLTIVLPEISPAPSQRGRTKCVFCADVRCPSCFFRETTGKTHE